jgi:predicted MFS family arabinose efflux permease
LPGGCLILSFLSPPFRYVLSLIPANTKQASFLATAILQLRNPSSPGWRYLFLIEGALTLVLGIASFFFLPSPHSPAFLTQAESKLSANRLLRDDPQKGTSAYRTPLPLRRVLAALAEPDLYPLYLLGLTTYIPTGPPSSYLTLILRSLGFSTTHTNLLTIPSSVLHIIAVLATTWISNAVNERAAVAATMHVWILPLLLTLVLAHSLGPWAKYALLTLLVGSPYPQAVMVAWVSRNSGTVEKRGIAVAVFISHLLPSPPSPLHI